MNNIAQNLEPLKNKLRNHSLYNSIESIEDLKIFTNAHVYAVWDFMSLLKFLQINLTSISVPWYPSNNTSTAKLINEIVAGEETDENEQGKPMSHFEMYLDSIESFGEYPLIVGLSLGSTRKINFRKVLYDENNTKSMKKDRKNPVNFSMKLESGSLFIMSGSSQKYFGHEIPKCNDDNIRYSLTFRKFIL